MEFTKNEAGSDLARE